MSEIKKDVPQEPSHPANDRNAQILTIDQIDVKKPNMYRVVLLNDDYTPMEFVVWILQTVFHKPQAIATRLMLDVHQKGKGVCGVYPLDVAQSKLYQVKKLAEQNEHPLECVLEVVAGE
jgi:ATP-dependent Clp protease adaptor protein ClpS